MRRVFLKVTTIVLALVCSACKSQKQYSFVMAELNPEDSISGQMDKVFINEVETLSKGNIKIQLYTDGVLGNNASVLDIVSKPHSEIHFARISPATLIPLKCTKHELLDVPFTFRSHEHFLKFTDSPEAQEILDEPYQNKIGVKGLFLGEEGFRHFFSTKPLDSIADFQGKKMRSAGTTVMTGIASALQSEAVTIPYSNLYSALQTGAADVAEQPITNYYSKHFNIIAPYMIFDGHQLGLTEVVVNSQVWDSLPKDFQDILVEAGKRACAYSYKITKESENQTKQALIEEGTQFTEVTDISEWQTACADIINAIVKSNTELYGRIITIE